MRSRGVIKERKVSKKLCKASWDSKQLLLKIRTLPQLIFHAAETHTHTEKSKQSVHCTGSFPGPGGGLYLFIHSNFSYGEG